MPLASPRRTTLTAVVLAEILMLAGCNRPAATDRATSASAEQRTSELAPIFVAAPEAAATGIDFVQRTEARPLPPAIVAAYRNAVSRAYTRERLAQAMAAAVVPDGRADPAVDVAVGNLARARRGTGTASATADPAAIERVAAALPTTRARADMGVVANGAAIVINGFRKPLPPALAASTMAHLSATITDMVRSARATAADDGVFPGIPQARQAAIADARAALRRLSPQDVAALDRYYAGGSGRAATDGEVAAFARANDAAATAALRVFLPAVIGSSPKS